MSNVAKLKNPPPPSEMWCEYMDRVGAEILAGQRANLAHVAGGLKIQSSFSVGFKKTADSFKLGRAQYRAVISQAVCTLGKLLGFINSRGEGGISFSAAERKSCHVIPMLKL